MIATALTIAILGYYFNIWVANKYKLAKAKF
jgi:hypothetical protein